MAAKSKKKKIRKYSLITGSLLVAYLITPFIPNIFVRKGINSEDSKKMQIIAHRGGAGIGLENTLSCIAKGLSTGADAIEIDIHLTKDGYLIVSHDETIDRMTNGTGRIEHLTLEEILKYNIVDENGDATSEHVPTFKEVVELIDGQAKLLIEIKRTGNIYQGIEDKLMKEIDLLGISSWVVVQSFNDSVLERIHKIAPLQRLEKLFFFKFPGLPYIFDGTITGFSFEKYNYISSFNIFHQCASKSLINSIHKQGKEVKVWTVNEPEKALDLPVQGIITDRPDLWNQGNQ